MCLKNGNTISTDVISHVSVHHTQTSDPRSPTWDIGSSEMIDPNPFTCHVTHYKRFAVLSGFLRKESCVLRTDISDYPFVSLTHGISTELGLSDSSVVSRLVWKVK